jgi:hypothetical protein
MHKECASAGKLQIPDLRPLSLVVGVGLSDMPVVKQTIRVDSAVCRSG